jgi:hypothetical protein
MVQRQIPGLLATVWRRACRSPLGFEVAEW